MRDLEKERLSESGCLGCAPFFFDNINIYDQDINKVPFKVFSSVRQMKELEQEIKDQICAILNSGGGIILFDCVKAYEKVIVKGTRLTEKEKEIFEQKFMSYLDAFLPFEEAKKSIKLSFVPVVADPLAIMQNSFE